jgi:hypothetical protein
MNTKHEDKLTEAASQLATEISPERDLWPEIEMAISNPVHEKSRWTPMFAQAAAVVLLIGASSGLTYLAVKDDAAVTVPVYTPELEFERAAFGTNHNLGTDYQDARADLVSRLDQQLERLSPEERDDVQQTLLVIREAIADINTALEQDPDNAYLQELLQKTYREELNVMRRVGGLTRNVMLRNDI